MPKNLPASTLAVEIATYTAVCQFNKGTQGLLGVFDALGVQLGPNAHTFAVESDEQRLLEANKRAQENSKEARMARRQARLVSTKAANASEGTTYDAGIDDSM